MNGIGHSRLEGSRQRSIQTGTAENIVPDRQFPHRPTDLYGKTGSSSTQPTAFIKAPPSGKAGIEPGAVGISGPGGVDNFPRRHCRDIDLLGIRDYLAAVLSKGNDQQIHMIQSGLDKGAFS